MLSFPITIVFLICIIAVLISVITRRNKVALVVSVITLLINSWGKCFSLGKLFSYHGDIEHSVSVLTFNVNSSGDDFLENTIGIADLILNQDADLILINEYNHLSSKSELDSILSAVYPFRRTSSSTIDDGIVFYSRFTLDSLSKVECDSTKCYIFHTMMHCDNGDSVNVVGCHLFSNNYITSKERIDIDSLDSFSSIRRYTQVIRKASKYRDLEVRAMCRDLGGSSSPSIVLGDFNDTPSSHVIRYLHSCGLSDAWWQSGLGFGYTFSRLCFFLRIDYVLLSDSLHSFDTRSIKTRLSDHNALFTRTVIR